MILAAVVIVYNPNLADLKKNIKQFIYDIDRLIIWDNSPELNINYSDIFDCGHKITYLTSGKNEGIAYALNRSFEWAINNSFDYILTMDQDSTWEDFKAFKTSILLNLSIKQVYIFAPTIRCNGIVLNCNKPQNIITSGAVFSLKLFNDIGYFRESFFIDEVDNEYCIRAESLGYRPIIFNNIYLDQIFGEPNTKKIFSKYSNNYSAIRIYYQTRNRIWVRKEYYKILSYRYFFRTLFLQILRRSIMIILNDNYKKAKLLAIIRGLIDGINNSPDKVYHPKEKIWLR